MGQRAHFLSACASSRVVPGSTDKQRLIELLEPALRALGYELVDLDVRVGRGGLLRVYIDRRSGDEGGVTLGDCELVSGQLGALLDVEDPLPGSYDLEVSSPGVDRRLRTLEHYERFAGEQVQVELRQPRGGRKRLRGRLAGVRDQAVLVEVEGEEWRVRLDEIAEARLAPRRSGERVTGR